CWPWPSSAPSEDDVVGYEGERLGCELIGGRPALPARLCRDDALMEVHVVIAGPGDLVVAVLALVDRGEVTAVLAGLPLEMHDQVSFECSPDRVGRWKSAAGSPPGGLTRAVGAPHL